MTRGTKVIAYVRVSTDEQSDSGLGLDAQREEVARFAESRGWELVQTFEDVASGKAMRPNPRQLTARIKRGDRLSDVDWLVDEAKRPALHAALSMLARGEAQALLVRLDRLTRRIEHGSALVDLFKRKGWRLVLVNMDIDTGTASGETMLNTMLTFSQAERRFIGERTRDALARKRAQGVRLGAERRIPEEVRQLIREASAAGMSYSAIAAMLDAEGIKPWRSERWSYKTVGRIAAEADES